jgi:hypothetical protein
MPNSPMNPMAFARPDNVLGMLRRMARPRPELEQCEFCSQPLPSRHRHLLEIASRKLVCGCDACALRFENVVGRWKLVPRDTKRLADFQITDAEWESFSLPIQLAFFVRSTPAAKVLAVYPSPAGATESLVTLSNWDSLVVANPALSRMEPDVEALLVNRLKGARDYFLAPIDVCFELVGLIRLHWRGFSGGDQVWQELEGFVSRLHENSLQISGASHGYERTL